MGELEELVDGDSKRRGRRFRLRIPGLGKKQGGRDLSRLFVFVFAGLVVCGAAFCFWPTMAGSGQTEGVCIKTRSDLVLSGILYAEDNPTALISTEIVHEGDVIKGARVVDIRKGEVEFEESGRRWIQRLPDVGEGVSSGAPVLLQLGSPTCPPCRRMQPILGKLRSKYSGKFQTRYIDVQKDRGAAAKHGVRSIPTQIFCDKEGREIFRHVGFYSEKEILSAWEKLGVEL